MTAAGGSERQWNGARDSSEEAHWESAVLSRHGMYELHQDEPTFSYPTGVSRIDRIYSNALGADQLDKKIGCAALDWDKAVSDHRPVAFARYSASKGKTEDGPLPGWVFKTTDWKKGTASRFLKKCNEFRLEAGCNPSGLQELRFLKDCMIEVGRELVRAKVCSPVGGGKEEEGGVALAIARAMEANKPGRVASLLSRFPNLRSVVRSLDPITWTSDTRDALKRIALDKVRESLLEELLELQNAQSTVSEDGNATRKSQIQQRLKRLQPGQGNTLFAVQTDDGQVTTDPGEMASALKKHWQDVFQSRAIDVKALKVWLEEDRNADNSLGKQISDIPVELWMPTAKDIGWALSRGKNSVPGPDGLPYAAWSSLGPLAQNILFNACQALMTSDAQSLLDGAFYDEFSGSNLYNQSLMVFLPKKTYGSERGSELLFTRRHAPVGHCQYG